MTTILVTGGAGYIGSHACKALAQSGYTPGLLRKFSQKDLRQWKRQNPGHRSFTVVRHPLERAHQAFCRHILSDDDGAYPRIRRALGKRYDLPLPDNPGDPAYGPDQHRAAFMAFLDWLLGNLAEQTSVRVDASWASQSAVIQGFGQFALPDLILREDELREDLIGLSARLGLERAPIIARDIPAGPFDLAQIYDAEMEKAAQAAYSRDYMIFGFDRWQG
jgi:hypothetical protein